MRNTLIQLFEKEIPKVRLENGVVIVGHDREIPAIRGQQLVVNFVMQAQHSKARKVGDFQLFDKCALLAFAANCLTEDDEDGRKPTPAQMADFTIANEKILAEFIEKSVAAFVKEKLSYGTK